MTDQIYRHTPDMGEISGFGGGYEACCQDMLAAGMAWMNSHPQPDLRGRSWQGVYGVMVADSDDARAMEKAVLGAAGAEATGAMHHNVMRRLFWIAANGWDAYCAELRAKETSDG